MARRPLRGRLLLNVHRLALHQVLLAGLGLRKGLVGVMRVVRVLLRHGLLRALHLRVLQGFFHRIAVCIFELDRSFVGVVGSALRLGGLLLGVDLVEMGEVVAHDGLDFGVVEVVLLDVDLNLVDGLRDGLGDFGGDLALLPLGLALNHFVLAKADRR